MCFTLVAPLGLPWWLPLVSVGLSVALIVGLTTISRARQRGFWKGLAVMRGMASRNRVIGLVIGADLPQLAGAVGDRRRGVGLFDSASRVGRSWIG